MPYPLEGVRAKLARGHEHRETLKAEVVAYHHSDAVRIEPIDQPGDHTTLLELRVDPPPPIRLGILVGEALQQYRSALDHLAYRLAVLKRADAKGPNFPIYTSRTRWIERPRKNVESPRERYVSAIRPGDLDVIERVQPFEAVEPAKHPLAILQVLSNLDKHETIHVGAVVLTELSLTPMGDVTLEVVDMEPPPRDFVEDHTKIGRFRLHATQPNMDMRIRTDAKVGIRFADDPAFGEDFLARLAADIVGIIDQFEESIPDLRAT